MNKVISKLASAYAFIGGLGIVIGLSVLFDALPPIATEVGRIPWYVPTILGVFLLAVTFLTLRKGYKKIADDIEQVNV